MSPEACEAPRATISNAALRAAAVAGVLGGLRGGLAALRFRSGEPSLEFLVELGAGRLFEGAALAFLPALGLAALVPRLEGVQRRAAIGLAAALGWAFGSHHLPLIPAYAPALDTTPGLAANAVAALSALVAAVWLSRSVRARWAAPSAALGLAAWGWAAVVAPLSTREPASWPQRPNLIVISLDTTRADHLGCYGYPHDTSPELDRFAESCVRFTRAYSQAPWTLTSHMTLLTSLDPIAHGLNKERSLAPGVPTLASVLGEAGYRSLSVTDKMATWLDARFGFDRGFDVYHRVRGSPDAKVDHMLSLLDEVGDDAFFLFGHFFDVHSDTEQLPYDSDPADYEALAAWYEGPFDGCSPAGQCATEFLLSMNTRVEPPPQEKLRYIVSLYDAGIRTLDRALGRLFRGLEERGLLERSVVLITADHGEEFYEHGRVLHDQYYAECLRVPFLLRTPETAGGTCDDLVGLIDVMPTFLEIAGVPAPEHLQGQSIADRIGAGEGSPPREYLTSAGRGQTQGLRTERWAVVRGGERGWRVYDLHADLHERSDLVEEGTAPEEVADWIRTLKRQHRESRALRDRFAAPAPAPELSSEEIRALEAMGYVDE